jgi:hypothetical protein
LNYRQFKAFYHKFWPLLSFFFRGYLALQTNILQTSKKLTCMQKELLTKKDYAAVGGEIGRETATEFIKAFGQAHPNENHVYYLGRNIIDKILAQPGCVGMRFYYGLNAEGKKTLVYVGMDADGKDLVEQTMVMGNGVMMNHDAIIADVIGVGGGGFWPFK